jgi:EAL domain-containing protein (putative c-di-GMP-specific phosphodiesterase class I)
MIMNEPYKAPLLSQQEFNEVFKKQLADHSVLLANVQIKDLAWINAQYGKETGDAVIAATRTALAEMARSYVVGEISSTLYGVLCQKADDPDGLLEAINRTSVDLNRSKGWPFAVELAYGVVVADHEVSVNIATWISQASTALMVSSRQGQGKVYQGDFELQQKIRFEFTKLSEDSGQLEGFSWMFQPVHNVSDAKLSGFETLARWDLSGVGPISPDVFIAVAEEMGVVNIIDRWAAEAAAAASQRLREADLPASVSANASAHTIADDDGYVTFITGLVRKYQLHPGQLVIELTESSVIENPLKTAMTLQLLREQGIQIAIDDFGRGESNLANLANLPFDFLKLDKSLLRLPYSDSERSMLRIGADIGRVLSVGVLAEGVETEADFAAVKAAGVRLVQGYYFGRPEPLEYYL